MAEVLFDFVINGVEKQETPELDWYKALAAVQLDGSGREIYKQNKPVLIISFDGY